MQYGSLPPTIPIISSLHTFLLKIFLNLLLIPNDNQNFILTDHKRLTAREAFMILKGFVFKLHIG